MTDMDDNDKRSPDNWTGSRAARRIVIWMILWVLIELAIITWVFYASGDEVHPSTGWGGCHTGANVCSGNGSIGLTGR